MYIEREIPHIWSLMRDSVDEVISASDILVIGNDAKEFHEIQPLLNDNQIVIDLVRALAPSAGDGGHYRGICW
jgi:GDP-mannose 6-dehydrogenase